MNKEIFDLENKVNKIKNDLLNLQQQTIQENFSWRIQYLFKEISSLKEKIFEKINNNTNSSIEEDTNEEDTNKLRKMLEDLEDLSGDLFSLKQRIIGSQESSSDSHFGAPIGIMVGAGVGGKVSAEILKRLYPVEQISESLLIQKTEKNFEMIIRMLEVKKRDKQLLAFQKANIENAIQSFKEAKSSVSAMEELKIWKKLGSAFPIETMQKLHITPDLAKQLRTLSQDTEFLEQIAKAKHQKKISQLLLSKGISNVPPEVIKLLQLTNNADEVRDITKVLSAVKPIKSLAKGLGAIPFLDIIASGADVFVYFQESGEADLIKKTNLLRAQNKQQQANLHLFLGGIEFATGIATAVLACASSGPPGWIVGLIGGAVVGVTSGIREIADTYYYDVINFYLKNKQDYLADYRMEIKLAILQATVRGDNSFSLSGTESFASFFGGKELIEKNKTITLEDAYWAILFQEEKVNYPYISSYNPEYPQPPVQTLEGEILDKYQEQKKQLDEVIKLRMEYIKKFLPHTTSSQDKIEYQNFLSNIRSSKGIEAIEQIIANSKLYQQMKQNPEFEGCTSIQDYQRIRGENLQKQNSHRFAQLENLFMQDPSKVKELYLNILNFDLVTKDESSYQETYQKLAPQIEFIKQYYDRKFAGLPLEKTIKVGVINDISYVEIEKMLENMDVEGINLSVTTFDEEEVKHRFIYCNEIQRFDESFAEYTSSIGQNILYRIAKEIHGYTGSNDLMELINYYTPEKKDSMGIYFDDGWYININQGSDRKFSLQDLEKMSPDKIILLFTFDMSFLFGPRIITAENIDTPTENSDERINKEFQEKIKKIVYEEKSYQTKEKKEEIKKNIIEYVKTHGTSGYIKLPFYLINDAKRAGIGNVEYFFYRYHDGILGMLTTKAYVHEQIDLSLSKDSEYVKTTISYLENVREDYSELEKKYIDCVEQKYQQLMQLLSIEGWWSKEDELDLPNDFESLIADKYKKWQIFKNSLLGYDPFISINQSQKKFKEYEEYFENIYMGILMQISGSIFTNDIDAHEYLLALLSKGQSEFYSIENNAIVFNKTLFSEEQCKMFEDIISQKKIFGKTIKQLLLSSDPGQQNQGKWGLKQVIKSVLEFKVLEIDKNQHITSIHSGSLTQKIVSSYSYLLGLPGILINNVSINSEQLNLLNVLLSKNLDKKFYVSDDIIVDTNSAAFLKKEVSIKQISEQEQLIYKNIPLVVQQIQNTLSNVVWQGKRGNILFDPEKFTLTSWGNTLTLDIENLKIVGLDISYKDVNELLYMANMINWLKGEYLKQNSDKKGKFFFNEGESALYVRDATWKSLWLNDTDVIDKQTIKTRFPSLLDEKNKKQYIAYINTF